MVSCRLDSDVGTALVKIAGGSGAKTLVVDVCSLLSESPSASEQAEVDDATKCCTKLLSNMKRRKHRVLSIACAIEVIMCTSGKG